MWPTNCNASVFDEISTFCWKMPLFVIFRLSWICVYACLNTQYDQLSRQLIAELSTILSKAKWCVWLYVCAYVFNSSFDSNISRVEEKKKQRTLCFFFHFCREKKKNRNWSKNLIDHKINTIIVMANHLFVEARLHVWNKDGNYSRIKTAFIFFFSHAFRFYSQQV